MEPNDTNAVEAEGQDQAQAFDLDLDFDTAANPAEAAPVAQPAPAQADVWQQLGIDPKEAMRAYLSQQAQAQAAAPASRTSQLREEYVALQARQNDWNLDADARAQAAARLVELGPEIALASQQEFTQQFATLQAQSAAAANLQAVEQRIKEVDPYFDRYAAAWRKQMQEAASKAPDQYADFSATKRAGDLIAGDLFRQAQLAAATKKKQASVPAAGQGRAAPADVAAAKAAKATSTASAEAQRYGFDDDATFSKYQARETWIDL